MTHVCFVCADDTPPLLHGSCACRTAVHRECLQRMIDTVPSHRRHCAVCHTPYSLRRRYHCEYDIRTSICVVIKGVVLLVSGCGLAYGTLSDDAMPLALWVWICIVGLHTFLETTLTIVDSCEVHETVSV